MNPALTQKAIESLRPGITFKVDFSVIVAGITPEVVWHTTEYIEPSPSEVAAVVLDLQKAEKLIELKTARDFAMDGGFECDCSGSTYTYDSDTTALSRISNAIGVITDMGLPGIGWGCKNADGTPTKVMHTGDQLKQVRMAGMNHLDGVHTRYYELLGLLELAETEADLGAITW